MPLRGGEIDQKIQILRRPVTAGTTGPFAAFGVPIWAVVKEDRPQDLQISGVTLRLRSAALRVRDSSFVRSLTAGDRIRLQNVVFEIRSVGIPYHGEVRIEVGQMPDRQTWNEGMTQDSEMITFKRMGATPLSIPIRARVIGYRPEELTGGIIQGDRRVFILAADATAAGIPQPIRKDSDALLIRGTLVTIKSVDDSTWRNSGELMAYELRVAGA